MQDSLGQRLSLSRSNATIRDAVFNSVHFDGFLWWVMTNSNVSFFGLKAANISVASTMGDITEGSRITMEKCYFGDMQAKGELGFQISDSALTVFATRFIRFNFGLFQAVTSNITLRNSTFTEGINLIQSLKSNLAFGGVLSCLDCPLVIIEDTKFLNISARFGGAVAVKRQVSTAILTLEVNRSTFIGCRAKQAGALFLQNISFVINSSEFIANAAEETGGGIHASIKSSGIINHSYFAKNSAHEGGAVKWSRSPVLFTNVTFRENSADAYGPDIASYGVTLSPALTYLTGEESSGYPLTVVFELLDHYNHRVTLSPFKDLFLLSSPHVAYRGNNATFLNRGLFNFSELTIYAPPASTQIIQAVFNYTQEDLALTILGEVSIKFRACVAGEIQLPDRCEYCYPGNFSFSPSDANCSFCPIHAFCPGGNRLEVNSGYWRSAQNSSLLQECPFPAKCLGGENSACKPGFTGLLCHQCAPDISRIRSVECVECWKSLAVVQLCAPVMLILLLRWVVLRLSVMPNKLFVVKVIISHLQYLSALCFLRVSYPEIINWSLHAVNWVSVLLIPDLPLACFGVSNPEYIKAILGSLLLPGLLVLIFILPDQSKTRILSSSIIFYTPYLTLLTHIPLLVCQEVQSVPLLFIDMEKTCWQGSHNKYMFLLVLPSLIINIAGPIATVLTIRLFRPLLFQRYFPFWTTGYRVNIYDVIQSTWQGLFLCTMIATNTLIPLLQVSYCLVVLITVCTINVSLSRYIYISHPHFLVAEASLLTISLTLGFLSYYVFYSGSGLFIVIMILVLNTAFFSLCCWSIASNWLTQKEDTDSNPSSLADERTKSRAVGLDPPPNTPVDLQIST